MIQSSRHCARRRRLLRTRQPPSGKPSNRGLARPRPLRRARWRRPYARLRCWLAAAPPCDAVELHRRRASRLDADHSDRGFALRRIDCQIEDSHAFVGNGIINHNTVVIATLPQLLSLRAGDVTLVVAQRDELIEQTVEKMRAENPEAKIGVEKAECRAEDDSEIVVATVQTLADARLKAFVQRFHRRIALFVIDEAHHAAAPSYRAIVDAILRSGPKRWCSGSPRPRTAATA